MSSILMYFFINIKLIFLSCITFNS